ncbi:hypothetical protein HY409_00645 [Candidatus Gottesmanbacteria bacterium]|nr:hypothetical protein [Candidatus Gottesmanbacteria bacterium]
MTATAHALVAGAIASKFPDPVTAASLSLLSHFIMDTVPHWDIGTSWRNRSKRVTGLLAILETVVGIGIAFFVFKSTVALPILALSIFFSLLPDWLETPWYIFFAHQKKHTPPSSASVAEQMAYAIYKTENLFHAKTSYPLGLVTQIVTVVFFLLLLK